MANENETHEDIIAEIRKNYASRGGAGYCGEVWIDLLRYADSLEAAHKRELETKDSVIQTLSAARDDELDRHRREVDALKRRRSELDAEVAAKDAVIMRLDAEIRKYQEERELRIAAQKAKESEAAI
jgi:chromosome segregation ATPase